MPKAFTNEEKKIIKNSLVEKGAELFGSYGLKRTNIEDLTNAVGIAKGSFYSFYNSKEELFLDVLGQAEEEIIKKVRHLLKKMKEDPKGTFKEFLHVHINAPKENPIIQQIANKKVRDYLVRKLHNNPKLEQKLQTYEYLPQIIEMWQKQGLIINKDPEILAGILKSIFTIGLDDETKEYIGREKFPEIIENLINIIVEYMIISDSDKK
ncbi:MAG: TetR/AcrR family transcriptional regulator [Promethearchaeota archaeon]